MAIIDPFGLGEAGNPFATPEEILPDWYFFATFELLRVLPSKLAGVGSMIALPVLVILTPILENVNPSQNILRRYITGSLYLVSLSYSI